MSNVVGQLQMRNRMVKVTREIAAKHGWETADLRLKRHLSGKPAWLSFVTKALQEKPDAPKSA